MSRGRSRRFSEPPAPAAGGATELVYKFFMQARLEKYIQYTDDISRDLGFPHSSRIQKNLQ